MRILHVVTTLDVGGAEVHLLSQVRGQVERGNQVRVSWLKGSGALAPEMREAGAGWVGKGGLWTLARCIRWADLVHSHLLKADMACAVLATSCLRRSRLVSSKHNDEQVLRRRLVSIVHGLLGNLPVRTIVLSDHVGRFFVEHGRLDPRRIRRVYYGIDPAPFETAAPASRESFGFAAEDVVFTCVARFAPQKAHGVLLRALAQVESPRVKLLLVGDDPFGDGRRRAEAEARELGLGGRAVFAGIRRDVPAILSMSDGFVMASLWEGLGLVFLEAMAAGLPVVATRVSAVPEVVIDGETGLLVPSGDPAALAAALRRMAGDGELRRRLGRAGRARVRERFGLERMIEETLDVYREVKGGAPSGGVKSASAASDRLAGHPPPDLGRMDSQESVNPAERAWRGTDRRRRRTPRISRWSFFGGRRRDPRRDAERDGSFVDLYGSRLLIVLMWIALANVADCFFTLVHLQNGGAEVNPVADLLLRAGLVNFVLIKSALVSLALLVLCLHKNLRVARVGLWAAAGAYAVLLGYHLVLFCF